MRVLIACLFIGGVLAGKEKFIRCYTAGEFFLFCTNALPVSTLFISVDVNYARVLSHSVRYVAARTFQNYETSILCTLENLSLLVQFWIVPGDCDCFPFPGF